MCQVTRQVLEADSAVLACRVVELDQWCRRCGCEGTVRDTVQEAGTELRRRWKVRREPQGQRGEWGEAGYLPCLNLQIRTRR